jgi:hypothetical protein
VWAENKVAVQAWHLRRWPHKRPPRTPQEAARNYRARYR